MNRRGKIRAADRSVIGQFVYNISFSNISYIVYKRCTNKLILSRQTLRHSKWLKGEGNLKPGSLPVRPSQRLQALPIVAFFTSCPGSLARCDHSAPPGISAQKIPLPVSPDWPVAYVQAGVTARCCIEIDGNKLKPRRTSGHVWWVKALGLYTPLPRERRLTMSWRGHDALRCESRHAEATTTAMTGCTLCV